MAFKPITKKAEANAQASMTTTPSTSDHLRLPLTTKTWQQSVVQSNMLKVILDGLVLRDIPDINGWAILELVRNSIVRLGTEESKFTRDILWRNVVSGSIKGWVLASGVEPYDYAPLAHAPLSAPANVEYQGFFSSTHSQTVSTKSETPFSNRTSIPIGISTQRPLYRVLLKDLALRLSPNINARLLKKLDEGQIVECLPQAICGNWVAVQVDGYQGWVAHHWLQPASGDN